MRLHDQITYGLIPFVQSSKDEIVVPNFWCHSFEFDLFRMSKSGMVWEYEIKTSYQNFVLDANKKSRRNSNHSSIPKFSLKHNLIQEGNYPANYFTYVCPEGIIPLDELPSRYGLIYFNPDTRKFTTIRRAFCIHKNQDYLDDIKHILVSHISKRLISMIKKLDNANGGKFQHLFKTII